MPRVNINAPAYKIKDFTIWVEGKRKLLHLSQGDLARDLGISQPAMSKKLKMVIPWTLEEGIILLDRLQADETEKKRFISLHD